MKQAQGIDYGAYTVLDPKQVKPGYETDFSIVGFGWGKNINPSWPKNKVYFQDYKRKMMYSTFQHTGWTAQGDFILEEVTENKAHYYALDIERSQWGFREDLNQRQQSLDCLRILNYLQDNWDGRVEFYCGFYMHYLLSLHVDLSSFGWWCASPDEDKDNHPGSLNLWRKWAGNRELYDYTFDQYSWKGYAPNYGSINDKKSMDKTQCKHDLAWLDNWLGLEDAPDPPEPPPVDDRYDEGWADALERAESEIRTIPRQ